MSNATFASVTSINEVKPRAMPTGAAAGAGAEASSGRQPTYEELKAENNRLRDLVTAKASEKPSWCGYLYKYRPYSTALLNQPWELRFVVVSGHVLQYYKSERDTVFHPRGHINLTGTVVEVEGVKNRRYWAFGVIDPASGLSLIRLSSESETEAQTWIEALEKAGCTRRNLSDHWKSRSPLRSADVRWDKRTAAPPATPPTKVNELANRWQDGRRYSAADSPQEGYTSDSQQSEAAEAIREKPVQSQRALMIASTPVHSSPRPSLLSSERVANQRHSGLINLGMVILIAANSRLILENLLKYGIRFNPANYVRHALQPSGNFSLFLCWPALLAFVLLAYGIELTAVQLLRMEQKAGDALAKKGCSPGEVRRATALMAGRSERLLLMLNMINITAELVLPCYVVLATRADALPAFMLVIYSVVCWLKLVSYAHVNWDLRNARRHHVVRPGERGSGQALEGIEDPKQYPENVTLDNMMYFVAAPTLCYQTSYPKSSRVRTHWIIRRFVELFVYIGLMLFITEQYIVPTILNSLSPLQNMDWGRMIERVLKLALPTLYWWLIMFYLLFHVWLNILAEMTRFADREFYKDWWNATTIGDYWRLWNMPVHKWMLRHVYFPLNRMGVPKAASGIIVFFISAVFHELLVGVPLHKLRAWAFLGIMAQVPMMYLTEALRRRLKNEQLGNIVFWISFCIIGQPLSVMLYYHDWVYSNRPELLVNGSH